MNKKFFLLPVDGIGAFGRLPLIVATILAKYPTRTAVDVNHGKEEEVRDLFLTLKLPMPVAPITLENRITRIAAHGC